VNSTYRHLSLALLTLLAASAYGAAISTANDGIHINGGSFGQFTLTYPVLIGAKEFKPIEVTAKHPHATLKYDGGAQIDLQIAENGEVALKFLNLPPAIQKYRMDMLIDFTFSQGGTWRVDSKSEAFPALKPAKPQIFQGNGKTFELVSMENRTLTITVPDYSFVQVQDNREWNWKTFHFSAIVALGGNRDSAKLRIVLGAGEGGVKSVVLVDEFGQDKAGDWPEKVKSLDELKADIESEKAYYASFKGPARDAFGGVPGSGEKLGLKKTGFFHVEKKGARWHLVDPDGNDFFHLGICSFGTGEDFTYIKGREKIYAWLPPYDGEFHDAYHPNSSWSRDAFSYYLANQIRKFGDASSEKIAARMIERVRAFGFNSGGAFSGIPKAPREAAQFPYVGSLPINPWNEFAIHSLPGVRETFDPFDEKVVQNLDKAFAKYVAPSADDPLLIGFFLTNEPAHEDLPHVIPTLKGNIAAKRRLVEMLREKYKTVEAFNTAWNLKAESFDALNDTGLAVKTPAASADMKAYEILFFDTSHKLLRDTFRKYDTHHMLMGDRWQPQTANNAELCAIVGKYCEIVSVNYYTYGVDPQYLNNIHRWSGDKPMFLSEFHWCSPRDSGLPGGKEVGSQQERGLAYRNYVEQSAALGFVTGIEWFTLMDQARTGRFFEKYNGENSNCGIFSVVDRPWKAMVEEMAKTNFAVYDIAAGAQAPFVFDNPRFRISGGGSKVVAAPRAPGAIELDGTKNGWPGNPPETISPQSAVVGTASNAFGAGFRLCWDDQNLYVLALVHDATPQKNSQNGATLANGDSVELYIGAENPEKDGALLPGDRRIVLSAANAEGEARAYVFGAATQPAIATKVLPGVDAKSYTLEAAIPWSVLNVKPETNRVLRFDLGVNDSGDGTTRDCQLMWNGTDKNGAERTHWGRLKLNQ
jgi:hypothetical protein